MTTSNKISKHRLLLNSDSNFMQQLQALIDQQIGDKNHELALVYLAEALLLTEKTLYRKIKEYTQQTPQQYLQEIRLQKAHRALEDNQYNTTKEIAYVLGYSNPSYFANLFKKRFGYSPKALILKRKKTGG